MSISITNDTEFKALQNACEALNDIVSARETLSSLAKFSATKLNQQLANIAGVATLRVATENIEQGNKLVAYSSHALEADFKETAKAAYEKVKQFIKRLRNYIKEWLTGASYRASSAALDEISSNLTSKKIDTRMAQAWKRKGWLQITGDEIARNEPEISITRSWAQGAVETILKGKDHLTTVELGSPSPVMSFVSRNNKVSARTIKERCLEVFDDIGRFELMGLNIIKGEVGWVSTQLAGTLEIKHREYSDDAIGSYQIGIYTETEKPLSSFKSYDRLELSKPTTQEIKDLIKYHSSIGQMSKQIDNMLGMVDKESTIQTSLTAVSGLLKVSDILSECLRWLDKAITEFVKGWYEVECALLYKANPGSINLATESEVVAIPEEGIIPDNEEVEQDVENTIEESKVGDSQANEPIEAASNKLEAPKDPSEGEMPAPMEDTTTAQDPEPQAEDGIAPPEQEPPVEEEKPVRALIVLEAMGQALNKAPSNQYNRGTNDAILKQLKRCGIEKVGFYSQGQMQALVKESIFIVKHRLTKLEISKEGILDKVKNAFSKKDSQQGATVQELVANFDPAKASAALKGLTKKHTKVAVGAEYFNTFIKDLQKTDPGIPVSFEFGVESGSLYPESAEHMGKPVVTGKEILAFIALATAEKKKAAAVYQSLRGTFDEEDKTQEAIYKLPNTVIKVGNYEFSSGKKGMETGYGGSYIREIKTPDLEENKLTATVAILTPQEIKSFYDQVQKAVMLYVSTPSPWKSYADEDNGSNDYAYESAYDLQQLFDGAQIGYAVKYLARAGLDLVKDSISAYNALDVKE